ncbi:MAG: DUF1573 domain-containing protein [Bacteroidetes bacterium]|nr:DUF1573 domain-containing protein [Bacteroidota bacterium]
MQKQILFIFLTFIYSVLHISAQESNLKFKGATVYLGTIEENKLPLTVTFPYVNNSKTGIKIINIKTSNDCKITNWDKQKQIQSNISGFISIIYNNKNIGVFNEKVIVKTNEINTKEIILNFGGEIVPRKKTQADYYAFKNGALSFIKNTLNFGEIKNTQKKTDTLYITNNSKKTITLETSALNPAFANIQFSNTEIKPSALEKIIVTYNAGLRNAFGKTKDTISIQTNDEENPLKEIYLTADIFEDFSKIRPEKLKLAPEAYLINTTYDFRYAKKGSDVKALFNIKNKGKTQLVIRKVDLSCDCIKVNFADKIRFDRDSPIEVIMNTKYLKGNIHETVTLITNDPKNARIVLHLTGLVD